MENLNQKVSSYEIIDIPVKKLIPTIYDLETDCNEDNLKELVQSIKKNGILNPIIVKKVNESYEIIHGIRRYQAALKANLKSIPSIIIDLTEEQKIKLDNLDTSFRTFDN